MLRAVKILHFHPDGRMAAQFIEPLIAAERSAGHDSLFVAARRPWERSQQIAYDISPNSLFGLPLALFRILRLIKNFRPDVIVSHNTKSSPLPLLAARIMRVGARVYFNHGVPYVGYNGLARWGLRLFEHWNCRMATEVLAVAPDMCDLLRDVDPNVRPALISSGSACGLDLNVYSAGQFRDRAWRKKNHFNDKDVIVAFVGRPEKRKGFVHALHLWRDYLKEPRCKLVLCGAQVDDVLKFLPELPADVVCLGFVNNVPEVLSNIDMLILPSLHEGLSYATLEAMACGAIVLANDIPGIRCLVQNGVNGYLVQENSLEKYAELITAIANGEKGGEGVRLQARRKAEEFSRELFLPAYLAFLDGLPVKNLS